jgi:hypothetical protein
MTDWSAIVYGRTAVADRWWRALPHGLTTRHWAAQAALDTVASGSGLIQPGSGPADGTAFTPRMVLARDRDGTLVGVACRARQLDTRLCQDRHGRDLYCFAGWFTADRFVREIPRLDELGPGPASWAGAVYRQYAEPVWTTPEHSLSVIASDPGPAPWQASLPRREADTGGDDVASGPLPALRTSPGHVLAFPASSSVRLWDLASRSGGPFMLTTGWQQAGHAPLDRITHLCAADLMSETALPAPAAPVRAPVSAAPSPETADEQPGMDKRARWASLLGAFRRS